MLSLCDFSAAQQTYAKTTMAADADLGRLLEALLDERAAWVYDYDPLWREVIIFRRGEDAQARLTELLAGCNAEAGAIQAGVLGVEVPGNPAQGVAKRSYEHNKRAHSGEVTVSLVPARPGSGLQLGSFDSVYAPVLMHGVRRSTRCGPAARFPITDVELRVHSAFAGDGVPALADLHAAATYAASRAFLAAGMKAYPSLLERSEPYTGRPFPELENSAADSFANLLEIFAYPIEALGEEERSQLGAFIAYLLSLLFGHQLDARMRRQPKLPPEVLRRVLSHQVGELASRAAQDGRAGAGMVAELLQVWVKGWSNSFGRGATSSGL